MRGWSEYSRLWGSALALDSALTVSYDPKDLTMLTHEQGENIIIFTNGRDAQEQVLLDLLKKPKRPRVFVYVHDFPIHDWTKRWGNDLKSWPPDLSLYFEILRAANWVVTQSQVQADVIRELLGIQNVQVLDMCLDTLEMEHYEEHISKTPFHGRWWVGYVSRILPQKGQMDLVRAMNLVFDSKPLCLAGRKYDRSYVMDILKVSKQNLTLGIKVPDHVVYEVAKFSMVGVSPSYFEGWGMFPARVAWFGNPLVLYDIPVFREIYRDWAVFVPSGNVPALAEALKTICADPSKYQQASRGFVEAVRRRWSAQTFADRFRKLVNV